MAKRRKGEMVKREPFPLSLLLTNYLNAGY